MIAVYDQESHNLPPEARSRLRRNQRAYADVWTDTLLAVRPELDREAATMAVHGAFGLINSLSDHVPRLPEAQVAEMLRTMTRAALRAGV